MSMRHNRTMSTRDLSYAQYWHEVESLAVAITAEAKEYGTDLHDALHETIDGHRWVIYTGYHFDVAKHGSEDAWLEVYHPGEMPTPETFDRVRAFYALMADVSEHSAFGEGLEE